MSQLRANHSTTSTATSQRAASGRGNVIIVVVVGLLIVLAIGWIVSGLPGLHGPNVVSVALMIVAIISGSLTLLFVANALRKARKRESTGPRDIVIVVMCSAITAVVALVQLIQTIQQLPH